MRMPKYVAAASYYLATSCIEVTKMCLLYGPSFIACICINLACYWLNYQPPNLANGLPWYTLLEANMTTEELEKRTEEYKHILHNYKDFGKRRGYVKYKVLKFAATSPIDQENHVEQMTTTCLLEEPSIPNNLQPIYQLLLQADVITEVPSPLLAMRNYRNSIPNELNEVQEGATLANIPIKQADNINDSSQETIDTVLMALDQNQILTNLEVPQIDKNSFAQTEQIHQQYFSDFWT